MYRYRWSAPSQCPSCLAWVQSLIVLRLAEPEGLNVPGPIVSRIQQVLSDGMLAGTSRQYHSNTSPRVKMTYGVVTGQLNVDMHCSFDES